MQERLSVYTSFLALGSSKTALKASHERLHSRHSSEVHSSPVFSRGNLTNAIATLASNLTMLDVVVGCMAPSECKTLLSILDAEDAFISKLYKS
eukprot:4757017-Amphidinium_carterae.1